MVDTDIPPSQELLDIVCERSIVHDSFAPEATTAVLLQMTMSANVQLAVRGCNQKQSCLFVPARRMFVLHVGETCED